MGWNPLNIILTRWDYLHVCLLGPGRLGFLFSKKYLVTGGSKGGARVTRPLSPHSFIFMQFSAKILLNNRFLPPIWEILDPPLLVASVDDVFNGNSLFIDEKRTPLKITITPKIEPKHVRMDGSDPTWAFSVCLLYLSTKLGYNIICIYACTI